MPVGKQQLGAEHPDRKVQHQHRGDTEDEIVQLDAPVLWPAPAFGIEKVRVDEIDQRSADCPDHRERYVAGM